MTTARPTSTHAALVVTTASLLACLVGGDQPEVCAAYLDCAGENTPEILPTLTPTYGEDGSCWKEGKDEREACEAACEAALTVCEADADADTDADADADTDSDTDADISIEYTWDSTSLTVDVLGGGVSSFELGIAETIDLENGWFGEDCLNGTAGYELCHFFSEPSGRLNSIYDDIMEGTKDLDDLQEGRTTLFEKAFDDGNRLTYLVILADGSCYVWGQRPNYYLGSSTYFDCTGI
jgi:hypothetical protein